MRRAVASILVTVMALPALTGCAAVSSAGTTPPADSQEHGFVERTMETVRDANFRLLISDEPNAIGDFEELWVTISAIGIVPKAAEADVMISLDPMVSVNLVELLDENAVALWEGHLPPGEYSKVFLHIDQVSGWLVGAEEQMEVKLPSNTLHLDMRFTVGEPAEDELTNFVYDIAVIRAGNSGQYLLKPQLSQSRVSQPFRWLEHARERIQHGRPDWANRPEWAGRPDGAGNDFEGLENGAPGGGGKARLGRCRTEHPGAIRANTMTRIKGWPSGAPYQVRPKASLTWLPDW